MTGGLVIRPSRPDETEWLYELHRAAMRDQVELAYGPWDDEQQRAFFGARPAREIVDVLEVAGQAVGTLRRIDEPGVVEISLLEILPDHQRRGIGTRVLEVVLDEATQAGASVVLQVLKANQARALYERVGFTIFEETATHYRMRR